MPFYYLSTTGQLLASGQLPTTQDDDGTEHLVIPIGAVEITAARYHALFAAIEGGHQVMPDADGQPRIEAAGSELSLAQAQAQRIDLLSLACERAITAGFTSKALGIEHRYGSLASDQRNLTDALLVSIGADGQWATPLWCANGDLWAMTLHSAQQVHQVHSDWMAFRLAAQQLFAERLAQVQACLSQAQVEQISWES